MHGRRLISTVTAGGGSGVSITNRTVNVLGAGYQEAGYQLTNTGVVNELDNGAASFLESWLSSGSPSDYQVRVTDIGGGLTGGSGTGSWLSLGTTRQWWVGESFSGSSISNDILVEIRDVATSTVQDSATITLNVFVF